MSNQSLKELMMRNLGYKQLQQNGRFGEDLRTKEL